VTGAGRSGDADAVVRALSVPALADEWRHPLTARLAG